MRSVLNNKTTDLKGLYILKMKDPLRASLKELAGV
jgi:hypothetical protein